MECINCGDSIDDRRAALNIKLCMSCGEIAAKNARKTWTVVPLHKSNYVLVTNRDELVGMNNKGGQTRT